MITKTSSRIFCSGKWLPAEDQASLNVLEKNICPFPPSAAPSFQVKSGASPAPNTTPRACACTARSTPAQEGKRRDWKEELAVPDWRVAGLISKKHAWEACHGHCKWSRSPYPPAKVLKACVVVVTGFSDLYHPAVSTTHCSLNAAFFERVLVQGRGPEWTFQGQEE